MLVPLHCKIRNSSKSIFSLFYWNMIPYNAIEEFNVDSKAECVQLNLAHVAGNKKCNKEETKTNKCQCPLSPVQV